MHVWHSAALRLLGLSFIMIIVNNITDFCPIWANHRPIVTIKWKRVAKYPIFKHCLGREIGRATEELQQLRPFVALARGWVQNSLPFQYLCPRLFVHVIVKCHDRCNVLLGRITKFVLASKRVVKHLRRRVRPSALCAALGDGALYSFG